MKYNWRREVIFMEPLIPVFCTIDIWSGFQSQGGSLACFPACVIRRFTSGVTPVEYPDFICITADPVPTSIVGSSNPWPYVLHHSVADQSTTPSILKYFEIFSFSLCVSSHLGGHPIQLTEGYPFPGPNGGTPSSWWGTPSQVWMGGTPSSWCGGVTPSQVWMGGHHPADGGYPFPGLDGGYPIQLTGGTLFSGLNGGYPSQLMGGTPTGVPWQRYLTASTMCLN